MDPVIPNMKVNTNCRMCKGKSLRMFLDLGKTPLANAFLREKDLNSPEQTYPLRVFFCESCHLSQLVDVVSPEVLFRDYVYFSSGVANVPEHFRRYAENVVERFLPGRSGFVVEIGSNDGVLLGVIKNLGINVLGVDPAENIAVVANSRGIPTLPEFFSVRLADSIAREHGKADAIIANNVFAHIDDHYDLIRGVRALLKPKGAFIFEAPYIVDMFENLAFDTIYHEHLSFLSVKPLVQLFNQFGMEVFDVEIHPVHGNSIRIFAGHKGAHPVSSRVHDFLEKEQSMGLSSFSTYEGLASAVSALKEKLLSLLQELHRDGKKIAAYGAPARGNTILNYLGVNRELISFATEELPSKIGFYTPGTRLPIIPIAEARKNPPDYFLLLAWSYKDMVLKKEQAFREQGGKFILPVGDVSIV